MEIYRVRGAQKSDVLDKAFNIGIGISLGNKWYTDEHILSYISWALTFSKGPVIIYVADNIHWINLAARNGIPQQKAFEKAKKIGLQLIVRIQSLLPFYFSAKEIERICVTSWDGIATTEYLDRVNYLYDKFKNDTLFSSTIFRLIKTITQNENRVFSRKALLKLTQYLLEELPELIDRVPIAGVQCDAYIYPYDNEVTKFVEQLQTGEIFPDIRDHIMLNKAKIFIELR